MRIATASLIVVLGALLVFWGCEGPEGPAGPQGPPGPGLQDTLAMYLGDNADNCGHCHEGKVSGWMTTNHSFAHDSLVSGPNYTADCNPCHTTGYNTAVNNGGYDENPVEALANVQCEACHGPMGPNPATHEPDLQDNLSGATCAASCHTTQPAEWAQSKHGSVLDSMSVEDFIGEWGGSSCNYCHIAEGFLHQWDSDWPVPDFSNGEAHMIGCGICHDAHDKHVDLQIRAQEAIALPYPAGYTIDGWGEGLLCGNCHRGRRTEANMTSQFTDGSSHFGEHESCQGDMVAGIGSYDISGFEVAQTPNQHEGMLDNVCVNCHMRYEEGAGGPSAPSSAGHTFEPEIETCQTCHPGATDFNIGGVQTEVEAKMEELQTLILDNNPVLADSGWSQANVGNIDISNYEDRVAAWAWFFVETDKSFGVHNKDYALNILQASIDYYNSIVAGKRDQSPWSVR